MKSNNKTNYVALLILIVVLIIVGIAYAYGSPSTNQNGSPIVTTPVGTVTGTSTTGSTGTATSSPVVTSTSTGSTGSGGTTSGGTVVTTPTENETTWQAFASPATGISFKYPVSLSTNYIRTVDWPPVVTVTNNAFLCTQAGSATAPGGQTSLVSINGNPYCVTVESGGAAGSIYYQYAYTFPKAGKTMIMTFTLQYPQCVNYPDPQMSQCKTEEAALNINEIGSSIAQSVKYSPQTTPSQPSTGSTSSAISISSISPGSGSVGTTLTITGNGFTADNKVLFGGSVGASDVHLSGVTNGHQTITFPVPSSLTADCRAGQACPMYAILVQPATYSVSVENDNGVSNVVQFTVTK